MPDYTYINHKVKKGETLWGLSKQYNVEQHKIRQANPEIKITHNGTYEIAHLKIGQIIRIPQEKQIYTNKKTGKKGVKAINGNTLPQAGIKEKYWVTGWYPGTPIEMKNPANVKWAVYYKEKGRYTLKLKKETGEFTFHEQAIGKDIKIVGYLYNPELDNDSALNIKVVTNQTPSITSLILYNIKKEKPLPRNVKLKLGQSIYVVANTTNCVGKKIEFALQKKEEKAGVTNYIPIIQNTEKVSTKGTATTIFKLDDLNLLINSSKTQNYWISAQLEGSENTPYIYENEVEVEKESSKKLPNEEKKKKEDSIIYKGKIAIQEGWNKLKDMYIKKTTSNEPQIQRVSLYSPENKSQVSYKETLKLKIEGIYLKGKSIEYIVYEEDQSQKKELIIDTVQMMGDVQEVDILLTQERFKKGGTNKEELTEGKHEIYVEVKLKEKELVKKTEIIVVDTSTQEIDPIPGNRPVTTGDPEVNKNKKCVCEEYDLIWGAKVSCEFRKKVVEICKELWPSDYLNMANYLMAIMAWETGETFSPSIKNPKSSATGLIQFMKKTAEEFGTTVDKLKKMTALEQLDYVKKYFYPQRNKKLEFVDFYLLVLFPASMGKPDNHVVFSKDGRGLNKKDRYYSERIKAYPVNKGFDTNPKYGNNDGMVTKAEIKKGIQKYIDKGEINKTTIFNCGVKVEKDFKKENIIKWHDPVDNPRRTKYNSYGNIKPVNGAYGNVRKGYTKYHSGLDLFALPYIKDEFEGTKIYACLDGIVTNTAAGPQAGKAIRLKINNVKDLLEQEKKVNYKLEFNKGEEMGINIKETDTVYFIYLHLSKVLVKNNQMVKAGDIIGYTGVSGSIATNIPSPHLHLEIATIENAYNTGKTKRTNPARFIKLNSYNTKDQDVAVNYKYSENGYKTKWNAPKKDQTKD
ncbi:LysM peptidoglycan-binding domain-containing M23 family metallopeptidase [Apibacter sp. B2966]|uniref:LysM peptidoglycan-binding domain-containing M23 family metallopeptidase n=1 Tax=Apibacter sp. B2966 TaxID=2656761 RepID=UPI0014091EEF|nr:peptidoglycan DD-metalloendopeptidase family protein [Apibacter sp. B2966]QII72246.1 LysM peptidoglycan-binding domain-containing M23 family metallopeptidase [Apibacter sp. B2966]